MAYKSTPNEQGGVEQTEGKFTPRQRQEGGTHYEIPIQPIEYIYKNGLGFIEGNIIKYITRHREKNGAEDIRKTIHYCELLLELEYDDG